MTQQPRVLIVEDHSLLGESLALALRLRGIEDVHLADPANLDRETILGCVEDHRPDVVLLDLFLGAAGPAVDLIPPIVERGPTVLVLTASQDPVLLGRCLEAGASGAFDKAQPFQSLVTWVTDAASGRATMRPVDKEHLLNALEEHRRDTAALESVFDRLTEREVVVLRAIIDGDSADVIAAREVVAVSTVRSHIRSILEKLGVNSQLAAVALARRAGWPGDEAGSRS